LPPEQADEPLIPPYHRQQKIGFDVISRLQKNYVGTLEFRWSARVAQHGNTPAE
jgi:hypothetical protein